MMENGKIRIGNQTSVAAAEPFEPFDFALTHGFDAFEWFADRKGDRGFDFWMQNQAQREGLGRRGREAGMRFSVHAPWNANPLDPREAEALHGAIDFAGAVNAGVVVFHLKAGTDHPALAEALRPVVSHADGAGVRLALENEPGTPPEQFNDLFERLSDRDHAPHRVGMCFDMGHANLHPATLNDYIGYLDRLAPHVPIIHMHVHENLGDHDSHLPVGRGPAGRDGFGLRALAERLEQRGYDGAMIMEQWPDPPTLLCEARDFLYQQIAHQHA